MRVPLSWLGEFVDLEPGTTPEEVHAALVSVGLEEEEIHTFELSGPIVVGQVLEFVEEPQTNGKTIRWCQVRVAPEARLIGWGGRISACRSAPPTGSRGTPSTGRGP